MGTSDSMSPFTSSMARSLVDGLGEGEGVLELALPRRVGREGVAPHVQAQAVELDELLGDLVHRGARLGPGALPLRPAQAVEGG